MTELPRVEARMSAQERLTTMLHARIEELALDIAASFRQFADTQREAEQKTGAIDTNLAAIKAEIAEVKTEMSAMESRILAAFKDLLTMMNERLPQKSEETP